MRSGESELKSQSCRKSASADRKADVYSIISIQNTNRTAVSVEQDSVAWSMWMWGGEAGYSRSELLNSIEVGWMAGVEQTGCLLQCKQDIILLHQAAEAATSSKYLLLSRYETYQTCEQESSGGGGAAGFYY